MVRVWSVHMRHLIRDLAREDARTERHYVPRRLFKIEDDLNYPEQEHPVLQGNFQEEGICDAITIFHLAYIGDMFEIKKRYDNHMKKSTIHSKEYLKDWYYKHLFGKYPIKQVRSIDLPGVLLDYFGVDRDEVYFATHRTIELKHFLMMQQWCEHFKPKSILDLGCGMGMFGFVAKAFGIDYLGIELSDYAVETNMYRINMKQGDIKEFRIKEQVDLVLVLDVLEHISYEDLDKTLKNISIHGKNYIFSLPYLGDPNLEEDPTHKIKETREWWIEQLSKYFELDLNEQDWLYEHQLLVGKPK